MLILLGGCEDKPEPEAPESRIRGFGDLTWGQPPTEDMREVGHHPQRTIYTRSKEKKKVAHMPLRQAFYEFVDNRLVTVHLIFETSDPRKVAQSLEGAWGPPEKQKLGEFIWREGDVRARVFRGLLQRVEAVIVHRSHDSQPRGQ
jgi:hypothetical protein